MKRNMGLLDRAIRVFIAQLIAILFYMDIISGVLGISLIAVALVFTLTSLLSFCPLYAPFGIKTCTLNKEA
ncbi:YgaP family membrane protein [Sediminitomix flava]|uniref:Inner membrane protein YgaP-like transmembrane domain-containing protein n=1 Tax=Sediminitomix flava TaxID=379075 RepID=A0A315ZF43_SEDFL|nr:DUF2892 domain-containing protein [Sediminitomix flava]PWJ44206.1 Protein of unknown function (DUF2892) [Sediminitomix flava]